MTGINEVAKQIHENAVDHGWWDEERSFPEIIALCHSELSEALEEYRSGRPFEWYACEEWIYGSIVRIDHLREHNYYDGIDHGQDYTGLANYLFDHWTPEQGGHRWKQTRNARKPERETPTVAKRVYTESKPPRPPKGYILVETKSTKYGYLYFKYVLEPPKRKRKRAAKDGKS